MTLYSYDHCPYCVKARMIFGLKNVEFKLVTLLNDDEKTPISMIGQKMAPILEKKPGEYMPESLDIIHYVDDLKEFGPKIVSPSKNDDRLQKWLQEVRNYHYALAMPRWPKMDIEEFSTDSAQAYFTKKKEESIGPFSENLAKTDQLISMANEHLRHLEEIMVAGPYFWGQELSLDDFHVFAALRCLTTVKGFKFPERIDQYMNFMSDKAQLPLHWDKAI